MRWPWVGAEVRVAHLRQSLAEVERENERRRYDILFERYHELVKILATMRPRFDPVVEARPPRGGEDIETTARRRAEAEVIRANRDSFMATAVKDLVAEGVSATAAEKEAQRLYDQAVGFSEV